MEQPLLFQKKTFMFKSFCSSTNYFENVIFHNDEKTQVSKMFLALNENASVHNEVCSENEVLWPKRN